MEKIKFSMSLTALVMVMGLLFSGISIAQQDRSGNQNQQTLQERNQIRNQMNYGGTFAGRGLNFIDEDGNGICDRYEQGQGAHHKRGKGMSQGRQFIDEDGNGICDNYSGGRMRKGGGNGARYNQRSMSNGAKR